MALSARSISQAKRIRQAMAQVEKMHAAAVNIGKAALGVGTTALRKAEQATTEPLSYMVRNPAHPLDAMSQYAGAKSSELVLKMLRSRQGRRVANAMLPKAARKVVYRALQK